MKAITLCLSNFIKEVYSIDMNSYYDGSEFSFDTSWIKVEGDEEVVASNLILKNNEFKTKVIGAEALKEVIKSTKALNYEMTYIDEYCEALKCELEDKIKRDIENIQDFMADELKEHKIVGKLNCKIDWYKDRVIFSGKLKVLEVILLEVINAYGRFYFENLKHFKEDCGADTLKDRIQGHLHWLKETENIYGTIYDFFILDTSYIDYHGTLGRAEFNSEIFFEELNVSV